MSRPSGSTSPGPRITRRSPGILEERYGKLDILVNNAGVVLEDADFGAPGGSTRRPR